MKKFLSILLATMMVLAMVGTAFASGEYSITIDNSIAGYTYEVYQVFAGEISDNKLVKITWADGVDAEELVEKLVEDGIVTLPDGATTMTAEEVATALNGADATKAALFAAAVAANKATVKTTVNTQTDGKYVASGLDAGYYFVMSTDKPDLGTDSAYILLVSGNTTAVVKNGQVSHQKKLKDKNDTTGEVTGWQDSADYDIGDIVPFQLTGTVPADYDSFATYKYAFHDEMSPGLTFDSESVVVKVDDTEITTGYTVVTEGLADDCTFEVVFTDLKATPAKANSTITVEFEATLNSQAVLGSVGNPNISYLVFSNDAKKPETTGKTPEDKVIVFTYMVEINKVDQDGKPLDGATFKLEKLVDNNWVELTLVEAESGTYFSFRGLDDGKYKLTETAIPEGYNGIAPVEFEVAAGHDVEAVDPQLKTLTGDTFTGAVDTGILSTNVVNRNGATLPSTGGIGTTLFYLFGGIMAAGSALILIVRRRADAEEE